VKEAATDVTLATISNAVKIFIKDISQLTKSRDESKIPR